MARDNTRRTEPPQERIDASTGRTMFIAALGFDFFQGVIGIIPVVGFIISPIISFFIWLTFWVWLKFHGVAIADSIERIALMFGGFLVELIPGLNVLPAWSLVILITVLLVQHRDKKKIKEFYESTNTKPQQA